MEGVVNLCSLDAVNTTNFCYGVLFSYPSLLYVILWLFFVNRKMCILLAFPSFSDPWHVEFFSTQFARWDLQEVQFWCWVGCEADFKNYRWGYAYRRWCNCKAGTALVHMHGDLFPLTISFCQSFYLQITQMTVHFSFWLCK